MKHLLIILGLIVGTTAMGQTNFFDFYVQGGGNYTDVHVIKTTKTEERIKPGYGWQAGGGFQYNTHFGFFLFMDGMFRQQSYERDSISANHPDTVQKFIYNPLFFDFPFGVGYQLPLSKNVNLKFYGGINVQIGLAGTFKKQALYYTVDSSTMEATLVKKTSDSHKINYGGSENKKFGYDLASSNWGVQLGAGVNFLKSFEVNASYHFGISNIFPGEDRNDEINKFRFAEISFRYYIPNFMSKEERNRHGY